MISSRTSQKSERSEHGSGEKDGWRGVSPAVGGSTPGGGAQPQGSYRDRPRLFHHSQLGFTLIEILISVALIAVIMTLIWQTTSQSIKAKQRVENRDEVYHTARVAMDKMIFDLTQAFLLKAGPQTGSKQGSPLLKTVFKGESELISFPSLSHLRLFKNAKESEGAEIGYKLEPDPDHRDLSMLMRRESKGIDDNSEEGGVWIPLAQKIKKINLEYYDGAKFEWKTSWNSDISEKDQLPRAVKITLTFEDPAKKQEEVSFTTVTLIGMYKNAIDF